MLAGMLGSSLYVYKNHIEKQKKYNKIAINQMLEKIALVNSERDWLTSLDARVLTKKGQVGEWLYSPDHTMMIFSRNIKIDQKKHHISIDKIGILGSASNSIVDTNSYLKKIADYYFIPIELRASYIHLDDLKSFIDGFIENGIIVRKVVINDSKSFELVIYVPTGKA